MKRQLSCVLLGVMAMYGCSGKPSAGMAKDHLKKEIATKYGGAALLASFNKTNATEGDILGVKFYDMEYEYVLECKKALPIPELSSVPIDTIVKLDDFLKSQSGPWEKIDFDKGPTIPLTSAGLRVLYDAYSQKKSLLACREGGSAQGSGNIKFVLRENGWELME